MFSGSVYFLVYADLRQTKICKFEMTLGIKYKILWFQVTMYDTHFMYSFNSQYNLSKIKLCLLEIKINLLFYHFC